ncbi:hypothetical protein J6590_098389, partial [Homalodisca vitripennis]
MLAKLCVRKLSQIELKTHRYAREHEDPVIDLIRKKALSVTATKAHDNVESFARVMARFKVNSQ